MRPHRLLRVLKFIFFATIAALLFGFVVMHLWNWLMPPVFGLHALSFWQALGLLVLARLLFGGFHRGPWGGGRWRRRMMERWESMTPEEREKFRAAMQGRCRPFASPTPPAPEAKA